MKQILVILRLRNELKLFMTEQAEVWAPHKAPTDSSLLGKQIRLVVIFLFRSFPSSDSLLISSRQLYEDVSSSFSNCLEEVLANKPPVKMIELSHKKDIHLPVFICKRNQTDVFITAEHSGFVKRT